MNQAPLEGASKNGQGLLWKLIGRNKRAVTLNLSAPEGADLLLRLVEHSDVLIENFRPGVMERWGLGWEQLNERNPRLVMLRATGFGQFGPYAKRPGFGTLAEAMSGFADITGEPDGPPTLPPFGLPDGIARLTAAMSIMFALYHRDARGGKGQMIDLSIIEPLVTILGAQPTVYDQLGIISKRTGNRSENNAPRNTYRTRDGCWVAVSTSADSIAERVIRLVGHPEVAEEPWFASGSGRAEHVEELDAMVSGWIAQRDQAEVLRAFEEAGAAIAPVYNVAQLMDDSHMRSLSSNVTVDDEDLGPLKMQNVMVRMLGTPGAIRFAGRRLGQDNEDVYCGELGLTRDELAALRQRGIV